MTTRRQWMHTALASAAGLSLQPVFGQSAAWPSKPINYLVAFPAGGTTDILARVVSQKLGPALGTTLVIDNKGGAGGSVGSEIAARAPADGYNLLGGTISSHAINVSLYPKLGYDPLKSFTPVFLYGTNPVVLVVAANSPYKSLKDLMAAARANPENSRVRRRVTALPSTWHKSCWPSRAASNSPMCPTKAAHPRFKM